MNNNEKLMELTNDITGIKDTIESSQATVEEKTAKLQEKIEEEKQRTIDI